MESFLNLCRFWFRNRAPLITDRVILTCIIMIKLCHPPGIVIYIKVKVCPWGIRLALASYYLWCVYALSANRCLMFLFYIAIVSLADFLASQQNVFKCFLSVWWQSFVDISTICNKVYSHFCKFCDPCLFSLLLTLSHKHYFNEFILIFQEESSRFQKRHPYRQDDYDDRVSNRRIILFSDIPFLIPCLF